MIRSNDCTGDIIRSRAYILSASMTALAWRPNNRLCSLATPPLEHQESVVTLRECEVRKRSVGHDKNALRTSEISVDVTGLLVHPSSSSFGAGSKGPRRGPLTGNPAITLFSHQSWIHSGVPTPDDDATIGRSRLFLVAVLDPLWYLVRNWMNPAWSDLSCSTSSICKVSLCLHRQ